ncbi:MAG: DoxX-like family protein [Neisseria sp.]|nr:DoxX-like family protein [Neisseria sp.]
MRNTQAIPDYLPFSLGVLWLWSGAVSVFFAPGQSLDLLAAAGFQTAWRWPVLWATAFLDVLYGLLCFFGSWRRRAWFWSLQFLTVAGYSAVVALCLPENWLHPFAPLVKNLPLMALMLFLRRESGRVGI